MGAPAAIRELDFVRPVFQQFHNGPDLPSAQAVFRLINRERDDC